MQGRFTSEVSKSTGAIRRFVQGARTALCALSVSALIVVAMPALSSNASVSPRDTAPSTSVTLKCHACVGQITNHDDRDPPPIFPCGWWIWWCVCPPSPPPTTTTTTTTTTVPPTTTTMAPPRPPPPPPPTTTTSTTTTTTTTTTVPPTTTTSLAPVRIKANPPPAPAPPRLVTIEPFAQGSYALSPKLISEIQRMAKAIQKNHYKTVTLTGYTDNVFTAAFNVTLNQNRAQPGFTRLLLDLQTRKITCVGVTIGPGYSVVLVATNTTAKGRAQNRRVVATLKAN